MSWGAAIYDGYFRGKAVESATNYVLDKACVRYKPQTEASKTRAKVALYWLGISAIVAASINPVVPPAAGCIMGVLALIPFIKPLYCSARSLVLDSKSTRHQRIQAAAWGTLFAGIQIAGTCYMGLLLPALEAIPTAFAMSTVTVSGALYASGNRAQNDKKRDHIPWDREEILADNRRKCEILRIQVREYEKKMNALNAFIEARPDLKQAYIEAAQKEKKHIDRSPLPPRQNFVINPNDPFDQHLALELKLNTLEFQLTTIRSLASMYPEFKKSFEQHMTAALHGSDTALIPVPVAQKSGVVIEEVTGKEEGDARKVS